MREVTKLHVLAVIISVSCPVLTGAAKLRMRKMSVKSSLYMSAYTELMRRCLIRQAN